MQIFTNKTETGLRIIPQKQIPGWNFVYSAIANHPTLNSDWLNLLSTKSFANLRFSYMRLRTIEILLSSHFSSTEPSCSFAIVRVSRSSGHILSLIGSDGMLANSQSWKSFPPLLEMKVLTVKIPLTSHRLLSSTTCWSIEIRDPLHCVVGLLWCWREFITFIEAECSFACCRLWILEMIYDRR